MRELISVEKRRVPGSMTEAAANRRISWKREALWSGYILALAAVFGLFLNWPLVRLGWQGDLMAHLEKARAQRLARQFKEVVLVDLHKAYSLWQEGKALFIDARRAKDYQELHIQGAVNLPPEGWKELTSPEKTGIDPKRRVVLYCSGMSCDDALKLGKRLVALGFTQVLAFSEGFREWDQAGYPVDTNY
jgi:rhodanese-related sulfurtransferase